MPISIEIIDEAEGWSTLLERKAIIESAIFASMTECEVGLTSKLEITILLCNDEAIRELNRNFRNIDKPTNVLSFPLPQPEDNNLPYMLGDIAISFETVMREASDERKSLAAHTSHMAVHGFLHLLGFDHESDDEADEMESTEKRILARLGIADPYANSQIDEDDMTHS